ncbi:MAG: hypothetical protein LBL94_08540 [Prevotellaceae bacterium]|jgi:hypothetical protein|nr:hypothetical protein [Prevotellaceae bacterium]
MDITTNTNFASERNKLLLMLMVAKLKRKVSQQQARIAALEQQLEQQHKSKPKQRIGRL